MKKRLVAYAIIGCGIFFMSTSVISAASVKVPHSESASEKEVSSKVLPLLSVEPASPSTQQSARTQSLGADAAPATNLIPNGSYETPSASNAGLPDQWFKGGYGTNTRSLTYPETPAEDGSRAVKVTITSYTSGDAKWFFQDVPVTAGATYDFSDYSLGTVPSVIDAAFTKSDGSKIYVDLMTVPASGTYQKNATQFTVPAGVVSMSIYHLISQVGSITVDNMSLTQASVTPPPPPVGLIPNGNFEQGTSNNPTSWNKGGYGTNTRVFSYPVTGSGGTKGAQLSITSYASGDAKWYFTPLALSAGAYSYTEDYTANVPTIVTVQFQNADNSFSYKDIGTLPAAASFSTFTFSINVPAGTKNVTVFHTLNRVGTLTIDNAILTQAQVPPAFQNGAVTLRFDDNWLSQYQNAVPKLISSGLPATFYVVSQQIRDNGFSGYMSKAEIQDVASKGFEIGAHTRTHAHLTSLSASQQQNEIAGSRQDLLGWNVGPINTFAYPFGEYNQSTLGIVQNTGFASAASSNGGYVTLSSDRFQLERQSVQNDTSLATMKGWVDSAMANHVWLILTIHEVNTSGNLYSITPANFNALVDYIKQKGITAVTVSQGAQSLQQ